DGPSGVAPSTPMGRSRTTAARSRST
ncbi:uncharacterized protein METZ01_LOCUS376347, partial [marine metagenome]